MLDTRVSATAALSAVHRMYCTVCVDIFGLLIWSEVLKRFEDGSNVTSIPDTFKLIGKCVE